MSKDYEYIKFEIIDNSSFDEFVSIFKKIKLDKENWNSNIFENEAELQIDYSEYFKITSPKVLGYFIESKNINSWDFEGILYIIIENLEISISSLDKIDQSKGILKFEAHSYPYGGTNSMICLLRAFELIPYETNDGTGIEQIEWISIFEYLINGKSNLIKDNEKTIDDISQKKSEWNIIKQIKKLFK